uniref:Non-specific serine/threonine protein kinase n=1 Tax=Panagrolaimus sp. PS1159 TaxID=55785 RepID=A0AC35GU62_9BILA
MDVSHGRKIGEGACAEAFKLPMRGGNEKILRITAFALHDEKLFNGIKMINVSAVLQEFRVSKIITDSKIPNFVQMFDSAVVTGPYPDELWKLWNAFKDKINDDPQTYATNDQFQLAICLSDGGKDLEKFEFTQENEMSSVIAQFIFAIASAEKMLNFEHRDLHVSNVLIKETNEKELMYFIGNQQIRVATHGHKITIIDFGNARLEKDSKILYNDLSFLGSHDNDKSFYDLHEEIYQKMKELIHDNWKGFYPLTNVYWICSLLEKLTKYRKGEPTTYKSKESKLPLTKIPWNHRKKFEEKLKFIYECSSAQEIAGELLEKKLAIFKNIIYY